MHASNTLQNMHLQKVNRRSPVMKSAFSSIIHHCSADSSLTKLIKKVIIKLPAQRDFSSQDTMHHLLSLKLVSSSFTVMPISLNGSCKIKSNSVDGDLATNDSLLNVYAKDTKYKV